MAEYSSELELCSFGLPKTFIFQKRANEQRHRCLHSSDLVVTQINYFSFCITGTLLLMLCSSEMSVSVEITPDIS